MKTQELRQDGKELEIDMGYHPPSLTAYGVAYRDRDNYDTRDAVTFDLTEEFTFDLRQTLDGVLAYYAELRNQDTLPNPHQEPPASTKENPQDQTGGER